MMSQFFRAAIEECKLELVLHLMRLGRLTGVTLNIEPEVLQPFGKRFEQDFDLALNNGVATPDSESIDLWNQTNALIKEKVREMTALATAHALDEKMPKARGRGAAKSKSANAPASKNGLESLEALVKEMATVSNRAAVYRRNAAIRDEVAKLNASLESFLRKMASKIPIPRKGPVVVELTEEHFRKALGAVKPHCTVTTSELKNPRKYDYCGFVFGGG